MQKKLNIVLDLDDTLGDLCTPMLESLNKRTGKSVEKEHKTSYCMSNFDLSDEQFLNILFEEFVLERMLPFPNTKSTLDTISKTHNIHIVTARNWHPEGLDITKEWFSDFNLPYDDIIVVDIDKSKIDAITHLDSVVLAVDDRDAHCEHFNNCDKIDQVLVIDQPWNRKFNKTKRIFDIQEMLNHI